MKGKFLIEKSKTSLTHEVYNITIIITCLLHQYSNCFIEDCIIHMACTSLLQQNTEFKIKSLKPGANRAHTGKFFHVRNPAVSPLTAFMRRLDT